MVTTVAKPGAGEGILALFGLLLVAVAPALAWRGFVSKATPTYCDYPCGSRFNGDGLRGGIFFGQPADRMRRVDRPVAQWSIDGDPDISFYVRIRMSPVEFRRFIGRISSDPERAFEPGSPGPKPPPHFPEWFPALSPETIVGYARDESGWGTTIVRSGKDSHMYLIVQ